MLGGLLGDHLIGVDLYPDEGAYVLHIVTSAASDATTTSDSASFSVNRVRIPTESLTVIDTPTRALVLARVLADSLTTLDTGKINKQTSEGASDAIPTPTDAGVGTPIRVRAAADDVSGITDEAGATWVRGRVTNEVIPTTDSATHSGGVFSRVGSEIHPTTDVASRNQALGRLVADALSVPTDTAMQYRTFIRVMTETLTTSDDVTFIYYKGLVAFDTLTTTDVASRSTRPHRFQVEGLHTSDRAPRTIAYNRATADTVPHATDAPSSSIVHHVFGSDDVSGVADSVHVASKLGRASTEAIPTADAVSRRIGTARFADDLAQVSDGADRFLHAFRQGSEAIPTTDVASRRRGRFHRVVTEALTTLDAATRRALYGRATHDATGGSELDYVDVVHRSGVFSRVVSEGLTTLDAAVGVSKRLRLAADAVATATDAVFRSLGLVRRPHDRVTGNDAAQRHFRPYRVAADSVVTTDDVATQMGLVVRTYEDLTTSDVAAVADLLHHVFRPTWDFLTTTDQPSHVILPRPLPDFPQVVILSVEKTKVSRQPGEEGMTTVYFTFTGPVMAWAVRINSTNAYDGLLVASAEGDAITEGQAEIPGSALLEGANDVAIYVRSDTGWSVRV